MNKDEKTNIKFFRVKDAAREVGAARFYAPSEIDFLRAVVGASGGGLQMNQLCMACVSGDYPIPVD